MAHPGIRKVGGGVGVALLAGRKQIFTDHVAVGGIRARNIVYAMTIVADSFVGRHVRRFLLE